MKAAQLVVIRLNENSSISERHNGSGNEEEAQEIVILDSALAKCFHIFF